MSLKIKLVSMVSAFVLVLSMLLVGVLAAGSQTINLKGNVQFDITDSSLYVKDIRLMNSITGGNTLENFVPGFVNESFDLNLGEVSSTSGSITIELDVVNTTETTYEASTSSTVSNASIVASGTIAGDAVPLEDVATYSGVSGTITITITLSSGTSASINLDNIIINLEEAALGYNVTITHNFVATNNNCTLYAKIDDNEEVVINYGDSVQLNGSSLSLSFQSFTTYQSISSNNFNSSLQIGDIEHYAGDAGWDRGLLYMGNNIVTDIRIVQSSGAGYWLATQKDNIILTEVGVGDIDGIESYYILTINLTEDCTIYIQ